MELMKGMEQFFFQSHINIIIIKGTNWIKFFFNYYTLRLYYCEIMIVREEKFKYGKW